MKKRIGAALTALALIGSMVPSAMAVDLEKKATDLNNGKTTITLSVGASQETVTSNVVFVLDKSTSADVREAAKSMLTELNKQVSAGNTVNVAVVYFESTASTTEWYELGNSTLETIRTAIDSKQNESGTNAWLGLKTGKELLDARPGQNNHLVLVTDGIVWLWGGSEASGLKTIFNEFITNNTDYAPDNDAWNIWAGPNVLYYNKYANDLALKAEDASYVNSLSDAKTWLEANGTQIGSLIGNYERSYEGSSILYNSEREKANNEDNTYGAYVERLEGGKVYTACDAAIYKTMTMWQEIIDNGYKAYAFADTTGSNAGNVTAYPWASKFVGGLSSLGGTSKVVSNENISGMFNGVKDSILYEIKSGMVTDPIGEHYNFDGTDTVTLTVGGVTVDRDETVPEGYDISFSNGKYLVDYDPSAGPKGTITWVINTPVEQGKAVELSYGLTVDQSMVPTDGTVVAPTNGDTTLTYEPTTGGEEKKDFDVPKFTLGEKESKPSMEKTSNGNDYIGSVNVGDSVNFQLQTNLPKSLANYVNDEGKITNSDVKYSLTFHDVMSAGLALNRDSLRIVINETTLSDPSSYLKDTPDTGDTFTLELDLVALVNDGVISKPDLERAVSVYVNYTATVTSDAQGTISNEAWVNDSIHDTITGTPGTGGSGTLMFTMGGAALLAAAGVLFVVNRRKDWN